MRKEIWIGLLSWLVAGAVLSARADEPQFSVSRGACTSGESWTLSSAVRENFKKDFNATLSHTIKPVRGFSEALALRRFSNTLEGKLLGEYWIARAIFDSKLPHIALGGFASIAARPVTEETVGVQLAALGCINQILAANPSLAFPTTVAARLQEYAPFKENRDSFFEAAASLVRTQLSDDKLSSKNISETMALLKGSGAYEHFTRALWAIRSGDHKSVINHLESFFINPIPQPLKRFSDNAHLMLARSLYSVTKFDEATLELKSIKKTSNELAESLSELSWAYLQGERYQEAIGTASNLQVGGLRHTFVPEAPMVMAMALNEICQYPESIRAVNVFRKNYDKPYKWLRAWANKDPASPGGNLYPLAVQYIQKKGDVPDRIASEWIKSPLFLTSQDEINLLFEERDSTVSLGRSGAVEQRKVALELIKLARDLQPQVKIAKMKMKAGGELPSKIRGDLDTLRTLVSRYRRMQQAAPVWGTVLTNYKHQAPIIETKLVARVNKDLRTRTETMTEQLEEIAENVQLIEVEIYNGASQDVIWQNAHPDYKKIAKQMNSDEKKDIAAKTWDWGRNLASLDEDGEVWEDELGSFKANMYDNCSSKDKYIAIKKGR